MRKKMKMPKQDKTMEKKCVFEKCIKPCNFFFVVYYNQASHQNIRSVFSDVLRLIFYPRFLLYLLHVQCVCNV